VSEFVPNPGWLKRQSDVVSQDLAQLPDSWKRVMGVEPKDCPHPLVSENATLRTRVAELEEQNKKLFDQLADTCEKTDAYQAKIERLEEQNKRIMDVRDRLRKLE